MNSYIGYYRMPVWLMIMGPLLIAASAWQCLDIANDAAYARMLSEAPHARSGWLVETLPRPVLFAVIAGFGALLVAFMALQGLAALTRRRSFVIDAHGVRRYSLIRGREVALAWGQIQRATRYRSALTFRGANVLGRKTGVVVSLLGHKRSRVLDVIGVYRPDLARMLH